MNSVESLRKHEEVLQKLFSNCFNFTSGLDKWEDLVIYNMYDHNQFVVKDKIDKWDIEEAIKYQKQKGLDFLKIDSQHRLDNSLIDAYQLDEDITITMLQTKPVDFKVNLDVVIKDCKYEEIEEDIMKLSRQEYEALYGNEFISLMVHNYCLKAKEDSRFHYIAAYLDNQICGYCYFFEEGKYVSIDGLNVAKEYRKQYVASTIMNYIIHHSSKQAFLHADMEDTPKEMYKKMGFEEVDVLYEYTKLLEKES